MRYLEIDNGQQRVSEVALGCMGMSDLYSGRNDAESIATIHAALNAGINYLDTADMYGPHTNEVLIGNAIRDRRDDVFIATKFGIVRDPDDPQKRGINGRPEYVHSACNASLKRIGVDTIDLYYLHRVDLTVPIEETVGAMKELVEAGKVRYLGLSEASVETIQRANQVHSITAVQSEYSLWSQDTEEDGILNFCKDLGILFVAYSPLGRGFLTGKLKSFDDFELDDYRRHSPRFQGENFQKNLEVVKKIEQIGNEKGVTPAQLALAWVRAKGPHIVPLFGTKKVRYLEENLKSLEIELSTEDLLRMEEVAPPTAFSGGRYVAELMKLVNA
ncbi:aldo/keto reductase [uncultured Rubinisphaera sp.]|uniref:aldo/keto reductase n=1 Tax=uncultured Rubinisphaera sp. TaxID=1678686 RepID=UPI0030DA5CFA|tara:strand:+ start:313 stop:1305 length:993 start_codon:yes stop_codon:yes gene_type:complete